MRLAAFFGIPCIVAVAAACSAPPSERPELTGDAIHSTIASLSVVTFAADGTYRVSIQHPSNGDVSVDSLTVSASCAGPLEAFFDQPAGAPSTNEICFTGTGTIDLSTLARPGGGTWGEAIQSSLTQASAGYFSLDGAGDSFCSSFDVSTTQTNATSTAYARYLNIGASACPVLQCKTGYFYCNANCGYSQQECYPDGMCNPPKAVPASLKYDWCCEHLDVCY